MDTLLDDVASVERRCERAAEKFKKVAGPLFKQISEVVADVAQAWSGSWIGYHSCVYYANLQPPPPVDPFSVEWGLMAQARPTGWREWRFGDVVSEIVRRAGNPDLQALEEPRRAAREVFDECKDELVASMQAAVATTDDVRLKELLSGVTQLRTYSAEEIVRAAMPRGQLASRDTRALLAGLNTPPHIHVQAQARAFYSEGVVLDELEKFARQTRLYLEKRLKMKGRGIAKTEGKVFIGHGRSAVWRELKDFISDRLGLEPDEFNLEPTAGLTTKERLEEMLDAAVFALIIMTAEDEHSDATKHARENVIHEAGLFQGHLGFRRAIVLLEEGCAEFSNIQGLTQIRFPPGNIMAKSEEIRRVLEREGLLAGC